MTRRPACQSILHSIVPGITVLLSAIVFQSCAQTKSYTDIRTSTDRRVVEVIRNRPAGIKAMNASLGLKPAGITMPELDAFLSYNNEGLFKLIGLTQTGFTLFNFESMNGQFTLVPPNGKKVSGSVEDLVKWINDTSGIALPFDPDIIREVIDFYRGEGYKDSIFFIEEQRDYYILNQLKSNVDIYYPLKRWWIDKENMAVSRKEVFSGLPDKEGEKLFEILYSDFRMVDNILTPFDIIIKGKGDKKLLEMKFNKVEYSR
jgi:hypothetical protein